MTRWGLRLLQVYYTIHHIDGVYNYLADLGSRWGNQFAKRRLEECLAKQGAAKKRLCGGPHPLMTCMTHDRSQPAAEERAAPKRVLRTPHPKVSDDLAAPDLDLTEVLIMPDERLLVTREALAESQQRHDKERPANAKQDVAGTPLWMLPSGQVWVPKGDRAMQRALYALTHQDISSHRGRDATLALLEAVVSWEGMETDVSH